MNNYDNEIENWYRPENNESTLIAEAMENERQQEYED